MSPKQQPKPTVRRTRRKGAQAAKGMRLGGYVRVSSVGERDVDDPRYQAERNQLSTITTWAQERGVEVAGPNGEPCYLDRDVSGKEMHRPALDQLLADVKDGTVDGIIVARLDRLSRARPGDAMKVVEEMAEKLHKPLAIIDMPGADPTTSTGELVLYVMLAVSRFFSRQRGEKWSEQRDDAISQRSLYLGSSTPFGYRRVDELGNPVGPNARASRLDVDPVEGPIVTELWRRRADGESWTSLRNWLESTGLKPPAQRKRIPDPKHPQRKITIEVPRTSSWSLDRIRRLVLGTPHRLPDGSRIPAQGNRLYLGEMSDDHSGVEASGTHPPLTDPITWKRAVARVGAAPKGDYVGQSELLAGFVRCAGCSYKMYVHNFEDGRRFKCGRATRNHDCPAPSTIIIRANRDNRILSDEQREEIRQRYEGGESKSALGRAFGVSQPSIGRVLRVDPKLGLEEYVIQRMWLYLERYEMELKTYGDADELARLKDAKDQAWARHDADAGNEELMQDDRAWRIRVAARKREAEAAQRRYDEKTALVEVPLIDEPLLDLRQRWESGKMSLKDKRSLLGSLIQFVAVCPPPGGRHGSRGASKERVRIFWITDDIVPVPQPGKDGFAPTSIPFDDTDGEQDARVLVA